MPAVRGEKSKKKTRRHTRDVDQVHADLRDERHLEQFTETKHIEDLPGLGEFYCKECAKWFESEANMAAHKKAKIHKRRLRALRDEPHDHKAAERAVGLHSDNGKRTTTTTLMEVDDTAAAE